MLVIVVSIGIVFYLDYGESDDVLFKLVDDVMYVVKCCGGNCLLMSFMVFLNDV